MSTLVKLPAPRESWAPPETRPLDEAVWNAWVVKNRARERRNSAARMKAVKWVSIIGLLALAGLWSRIAPFDIVVRFIVATGAMAVMLHAFHARHYLAAAVFAALVVLYNPVAPAFSFSGDWQHALVFASVAPFVAALAWPDRRLKLI